MIEVAADFQELARHELPELSSQSRATRLHRLLILDTQLMVAWIYICLASILSLRFSASSTPRWDYWCALDRFYIFLFLLR